MSLGLLSGPTAREEDEESEPAVPTAPDDGVDPERDTLEGEGSPLDDLPSPRWQRCCWRPPRSSAAPR